MESSLNIPFLIDTFWVALSGVPVALLVIKTWPLFNKEQQEFADAYDKAMAEIKQTDELNKLMEKHYGRDLFEVLETVER